MIKNFILVAAFATLAFSCKPKTEKTEIAAAPDNEKILKEISYSSDSGYTKDGFSVVDAGEMVRNYKGFAGRDPRDLTKQNTRSVWFKLEDLTKLVDQLNEEKKALQRGDPNKKDGVTDGVRIYFGRYKTHLKHPERNTVVFVSTYWVKDGNFHQDYYNNVQKSEAFNNGELSPPNNFGVSWESNQN